MRYSNSTIVCIENNEMRYMCIFIVFRFKKNLICSLLVCYAYLYTIYMCIIILKYSAKLGQNRHNIILYNIIYCYDLLLFHTYQILFFS